MEGSSGRGHTAFGERGQTFYYGSVSVILASYRNDMNVYLVVVSMDTCHGSHARIAAKIGMCGMCQIMGLKVISGKNGRHH